MAATQGELDGLCGMYAIANAYERCGCQDVESVFRTACGGLSQRRWPKVLWEGTTFGDMQRMIKACKDQCEPTVSVRYPFSGKKEPPSNESYWRDLKQIFTDPGVRCAIELMKKPWLHWVVIFPDTERRIWFTDSAAVEPDYRKNIASLYAGKRRPRPGQWVFGRRELIVFRGP